MLCESCGINEAVVLMTTVVNGHSTSRNLCRECLEKYKNENMQQVLAAVMSAIGRKKTENEQYASLQCPKCGETYAEFQKSGLLGCAACYQAFREPLAPLMNKMQGRALHAGRRPHLSEEAQARQTQMEELRLRMEAAVAEENYEEAARLRDALRALAAAQEEEA